LEKRHKNTNTPATNTPPSTINVNTHQVDAASIVSAPTQADPASAANPGAHLQAMMAKSSARGPTASVADTSQLTINGITYRQAHAHKLSYRVKNFDVTITQTGALVDGDANGGMAGDDVRILEETMNTADFSGLYASIE
jgi:hypothetical protein